MNPTPRIVSGGQTGVDRGALDAALEVAWPCGGWCPAGRLAEDGAIPARYPLIELEEGAFDERTRRNVRDSDACLVLEFGGPCPGTQLARRTAERLGRPILCIDARVASPAAAALRLREFTDRHRPDSLNVAGPRASAAPDAHAYARDLLTAYFHHRART